MSQDRQAASQQPDNERLRLWHEYYSDKRMAHRAAQLDLVGKYHRSGRILEIGPGYGLMTAALANAGHDVSKLDVIEREFTGGMGGTIRRYRLEDRGPELSVLGPLGFPRANACLKR